MELSLDSYKSFGGNGAWMAILKGNQDGSWLDQTAINIMIFVVKVYIYNVRMKFFFKHLVNLIFALEGWMAGVHR